MHCEVCGKEISWGYLVDIEGARLIACADCAERGTIIRKVYEQEAPRRRKKAQERSEEREVILVDDYAEIIRRAREAKGLSREDLAKKLHIREGYLHKIEEGELVPTDDLARKLEKILGVTLFEEIEEEDEIPVSEESEGGELTLGDVVRLTWVKRK